MRFRIVPQREIWREVGYGYYVVDNEAATIAEWISGSWTDKESAEWHARELNAGRLKPREPARSPYPRSTT